MGWVVRSGISGSKSMGVGVSRGRPPPAHPARPPPAHPAMHDNPILSTQAYATEATQHRADTEIEWTIHAPLCAESGRTQPVVITQ
jgi:hypothetical protein